jgi:hypothetical protein
VKSYLKNGSLIEQVESREVAAGPRSEDLLFDDDKPVHNTVLYTTTFFTGLSPNEFNRVVSTLLGSLTITINEKVNQKGEDGVIRSVEVQKEKPLIQIWRESSDRILKECKLISSKDSNRAIVFADAGQRDSLKMSLEEEHGLYLQNKFTLLQESGLLFDASERIAKNFIRLIVDMAASYPDYYGRDWLFDIISKARAYFASAKPGSKDPILQLLGKPGGLRTESQVYNRISDLMRDMLDHPQLKQEVKGLIEQLMTAGYFDSVLNIVKNFRFVPEFDEFYWMKQLLDRGNEIIRLQTYIYLYSEIRRMGKQIYQILRKLAGWLPVAGCDPQRYSHSNLFALRLMIEYCLETTSNFDAKNYGSWPSPYPLLAVKSIEDAKSDFGLLAGWLFHPGMKHAMDDESFDEDLDRLLPALVSEWVFILLGQPQQKYPISEPSNGFQAFYVLDQPQQSNGLQDSTVAHSDYDSKREEDFPVEDQAQGQLDVDISAEAALVILLEQIIEKTNAFQPNRIQQDMLMYWEEMKDFLATVIDVFGYIDRNQRKEFIWKRNLIRKLLMQFRALQKDWKASRLQKVTV